MTGTPATSQSDAGAQITAFFDEATNSVSYLVADPATRAAVVVDPVLDFDPASGIVSTGSAREDTILREGILAPQLAIG